MSTRGFTQVDVFGAGPLRGNPVAVVTGADTLSTAEMSALARWTNLSETTFLLAPRDPGADYRLRIFTPGAELPFAGHPTLGSAHAWLEAGGVPRESGYVVQECGIGLVRLRVRDGAISFAAPPLVRSGPVEEDTLSAVARGLRVERERIIAHQWVDNGPGWLAVELETAERVLALEPDFSLLSGLAVGVFGRCPEGAGCRYEVRGFVPGLGVPEDPVTGSLNAGLAVWLIGAGLAPESYTASQGTALARAGRVSVERDGDAIWVGGPTRTIVAGTLSL